MPRCRKHDRDRVDVEDYFGDGHDVVPIAIPSRGREVQLCDQTLSMLERYGYNMANVHVFVDACTVRTDGSFEYDNYTRCLRKRGYATVQVHPGGSDLRDQYRRIFAYFKFDQAREIILTSDMVPNIVWRRRVGNIETEDLPVMMFMPIIRAGFDLVRKDDARAWSLASCKAGINLQPGTISRKCGLLCGNFCGVRLDKDDTIDMILSNYTTDVEFSCRTWDTDVGMIRFLGIAAAHKYRSPGGHATITAGVRKRYNDTCKALKALAQKFPKLIKYEVKTRADNAQMQYKFRQVGHVH